MENKEIKECDCYEVHENVGGRYGCGCKCHTKAETPELEGVEDLLMQYHDAEGGLIVFPEDYKEFEKGLSSLLDKAREESYEIGHTDGLWINKELTEAAIAADAVNKFKEGLAEKVKEAGEVFEFEEDEEDCYILVSQVLDLIKD